MLSKEEQGMGESLGYKFLLDIDETLCKNCGVNVEGKDTCPNCKELLSPPWWKLPRSYAYFMKSIKI